MKLSSIAFDSKYTKGRLYREPVDMDRDEFQRDRGRIIHSSAFRKLAYKTQAFVNNEGDYYRTRLTHSLEVAQIARAICYRLKLNQDLAETIALAHDLGHAPFGHAGEEGLQEALMFSVVNFEHNLQSLRIVLELEQKYHNFNGLNLTWESIEGLAKHNGPVTRHHMSHSIQTYDILYNLNMRKQPTLEAQVASLCDDIAYNNHDVDDALRSGFIEIDMVFELPFIGEHFKENRSSYPKASKKVLINEALRGAINHCIEDLAQQTAQNIRTFKIKNCQDVQDCEYQIVDLSEAMKDNIKIVKDFLKEHLYKHYKMHRMKLKGKAMVKDLFQSFYEDPRILPTEWYQLTCDIPEDRKIAVICDYIAGMTDRFAIHEYQRIYGTFHNIFHN